MQSFIEDGVRLNVINIDKFKTITIAVLIRNKLNKENVTANALLPGLLKRGSKKYKTVKDIYTKAEQLKGAVFDSTILKKGEEQIIEFYIEILKDAELLKQAIELLSEVIIKPYIEKNAFNDNYVESEKKLLKDIINSKINDKKEYAKIRCIENMCKDEPFSIYADGYAEDLIKINKENLYQNYKDIITTSEIEIIAVGDINFDNIENYFKENFKIKNRNVKKIAPAEFIKEKEEEKVIIENARINQGKLCIGIRCNVNPKSEDYYKLLIANEIFAGSPDSRLFTKIREKESLCYYINSFIFRNKSILFLQSGIQEDDFEKTVNIIKEEFQNIKENGFSEKEMANSIIGLKKRYKSIMDYPTAIMDFYLNQTLNNESCNIEDIYNKFDNIDYTNNILKDSFIDTIYFLKGGENND